MLDLPRLESALRAHEGVRLRIYTDTVGKVTVGVGHNLTDKGISQNVCRIMLSEDIGDAQGSCGNLPWYLTLDPVRANAVTELMFILGPIRFATFQKFAAAMQARAYAAAANEILHSALSAQIGPKRTGDLMRMIRDGVWP